jgi:hypothetical protein
VPLRDTIQELMRTGSGNNVVRHIAGAIFTQMTVKRGIRKHGQVAVDALFKEFSPLHDLGVFLAQKADKLTLAEKRAALRAISMVKEKKMWKTQW